MKKVNKILIGRPAVSTLLQVILEFYKLRLRYLSACCECTKLLEMFVMRTFMIQHLCPPGLTCGAVPRNWTGAAETFSAPASPDSSDAERSAEIPSCVRQFR